MCFSCRDACIWFLYCTLYFEASWFSLVWKHHFTTWLSNSHQSLSVFIITSSGSLFIFQLQFGDINFCSCCCKLAVVFIWLFCFFLWMICWCKIGLRFFSFTIVNRSNSYFVIREEQMGFPGDSDFAKFHIVLAVSSQSTKFIWKIVYDEHRPSPPTLTDPGPAVCVINTEMLSFTNTSKCFR